MESSFSRCKRSRTSSQSFGPIARLSLLEQTPCAEEGQGQGEADAVEMPLVEKSDMRADKRRNIAKSKNQNSARESDGHPG